MTDEAVHRHSPPEVKIALFRSLFRGRDDVYARRFESKKQAKSVISPLVVMNGTGFSVIKDGSSVPCARTVVFYP